MFITINYFSYFFNFAQCMRVISVFAFLSFLSFLLLMKEWHHMCHRFKIFSHNAYLDCVAQYHKFIVIIDVLEFYAWIKITCFIFYSLISACDAGLMHGEMTLIISRLFKVWGFDNLHKIRFSICFLLHSTTHNTG